MPKPDQLSVDSNIPKAHELGCVVRKTIKVNVSAEYADKTFAAMTFGCDIEQVCTTAEEERALAQRVYQSTMLDLKDAIARDPVAKSLWRRMVNQLHQERAAERTRQRLKAEKDAKAAALKEE